MKKLLLAILFSACAPVENEDGVSEAIATVASQNGARISATSALKSIVDSGGARWTLSGGKVLKNGAAAAFSSGVVTLLYYDGLIYQENAAGGFWSWSNNTWASTSDPRHESINGALSGRVGNIVDASKNVWVISSGTLYENGVESLTGVGGLLLFNGGLYEQSTTWTWSSFNGSAWVARGGLGDPRVTSASGTTEPSASFVIDASRNLWTIEGGVAYESGTPAGTTSGVTKLEYYDGLVYAESTTWHSWNGSAWIASSAPGGSSTVPIAPPTLPTDVTAIGYTDRVFFDDFDSLATLDMKNTKVPGFNWYTSDDTDGSVTNPALITQKTVGGRTIVRLDGSGASIRTVQKYEGAAIGPSFGERNGGGAYFEASIAYGVTSADKSSGAWPAWWANSREHMVNQSTAWLGSANTSYAHYLEYDFMEYFHANTSENYNSTVIDWYGEYNVATPTCDVLPYCKAQATQNLGPGKAGYFTSTEAAPVFHKYGALWVPSVEQSNGTYSQGYFRWFLDGEQIGTTIEFTGPPSKTDYVPVAPWKYSVVDTEPLALILGTGSDAFMYVDYAGVWQKP